jgi:opacity protein-like surface antigen
MMKKLLLALCPILLLAAAAQAADNFLGTWTLNVAKSKYDPGPAPRSQTTILEALANGTTRERGDRVNADGSRTQWEWTAKFDGKDYAVNGDPDRDMVSLKKIDDNTVEVTNKKSGKVTNTMKIVVAKDGKSRTNEASFTNAKGVKVHNIIFFDRK